MYWQLKEDRRLNEMSVTEWEGEVVYYFQQK